jgi:hypothetical protein
MATAIQPRQASTPAVLSQIENVLINGDLKNLSPEQRVVYYRNVCESVGLNPLTRPFEYLVLSGKMVLYARKDATEQLRSIHGISLRITDRQMIDDVYVVTAEAQDAKGRVDTSTGAVACGTLKGEAKANALMKAETKAKRRVTLSIAGLGMLDETEVETIPGAKPFAEERFRPEDAPNPADPEVFMGGETAEMVDPETLATIRQEIADACPDLDQQTGEPKLLATMLAAYRIRDLADLPAEKATEARQRIATYHAKRMAKDIASK